MSGRYASYWNAFLFKRKFTIIAHFQIVSLILRFLTSGKVIRAIYSVISTGKRKPDGSLAVFSGHSLTFYPKTDLLFGVRGQT